MLTDDFASLLDLDRRATDATLAVLRDWRPDAATPCGPWRLADLLAHMTVQHRGFASAARGARTSPEDWRPVVHPDPLGAYRAACADALEAFAALPGPEAPMLLPELAPDPLPARFAVSAHLVDNAVHAWDVARALGSRPDLDEDVLAAALRIARQVPDDGSRERVGAAFAHARPVPEGAPVLDELLLLLGRDPDWSPLSRAEDPARAPQPR